jgi:hypothetical protein
MACCLQPKAETIVANIVAVEHAVSSEETTPDETPLFNIDNTSAL